MLRPAVDHDEECRRWIALPKQCAARFQRHRGRRLYDMRDRLRLKAAEKGDAGNDFKIAGRRVRGHVSSPPKPRHEDVNGAERAGHDPTTNLSPLQPRRWEGFQLIDPFATRRGFGLASLAMRLGAVVIAAVMASAWVSGKTP